MFRRCNVCSQVSGRTCELIDKQIYTVDICSKSLLSPWSLLPSQPPHWSCTAIHPQVRVNSISNQPSSLPEAPVALSYVRPTLSSGWRTSIAQERRWPFINPLFTAIHGLAYLAMQAGRGHLIHFIHLHPCRSLVSIWYGFYPGVSYLYLFVGKMGDNHRVCHPLWIAHLFVIVLGAVIFTIYTIYNTYMYVSLRSFLREFQIQLIKGFLSRPLG